MIVSLQRSDQLLPSCNRKSADEKLSDVLKQLLEVEKKLEKERQEHYTCNAERELIRAELEDLKTSGEASREENDALLLEIDTMSKEVTSLRHGRKKYIQQIEEKRKANKKLHTLLAREEQAKSHCFEELAAVRLQVSSLSTVHKHQKTFIEVSKVRMTRPVRLIVSWCRRADKRLRWFPWSCCRSLCKQRRWSSKR